MRFVNQGAAQVFGGGAWTALNVPALDAVRGTSLTTVPPNTLQ